MQPPNRFFAPHRTLLLAIGALVAACSGGSAETAPDGGRPLDAHATDAKDGSRPDVAEAGRADASDAAPVTVCNGHAELCGRAYDQVAFPGTHDSYSNTSEGFQAPDQTFAVARQLADGIRVLHFEVHIYEGDVYACHGSCLLGSRRFADEMASVATFVPAHPGEMVTMLLERSDSVITANDIGKVIEKAGLAPALHVQPVGTPWPTLGQMLTTGKRLVALLDNPTGSSYPWLLPRWQLTWETPWDNERPADFGRCAADRGTMGDGVYVVDTYMEDLLIETPAHAALVNYDPFLIERLLYCQHVTSTLPTFVMVNFYDVSELFSVVDVLNGFAPAPPVNLGAFPPAAWPVDGGSPDASAPTGDASSRGTDAAGREGGAG